MLPKSIPGRRGRLFSGKSNLHHGYLEVGPEYGSHAFVVLSNKEKAARAGLVRQHTPTQCVRDDFLGETSLNAVLH